MCMKLNILDIFVEVLVLLDVIKIKYVFVLCLVFPSSLLNSKQAYDSPAGYDIPYFRPTIDETVRGQGLSSPQEVSYIYMLIAYLKSFNYLIVV